MFKRWSRNEKYSTVMFERCETAVLLSMESAQCNLKMKWSNEENKYIIQTYTHEHDRVYTGCTKLFSLNDDIIAVYEFRRSLKIYTK